VYKRTSHRIEHWPNAFVSAIQPAISGHTLPDVESQFRNATRVKSLSEIIKLDVDFIRFGDQLHVRIAELISPVLDRTDVATNI
jgi:hypothetical protein